MKRCVKQEKAYYMKMKNQNFTAYGKKKKMLRKPALDIQL
jgi:hypothetical protein